MPDLSTQPEKIRVHVFVSGRVQGVGYRMSTWQTATELGLNGWVRNLRDGRVEAVFEGTKDIVENMIGWCHQGAPPAKVTNVTLSYEEIEGILGFKITP